MQFALVEGTWDLVSALMDFNLTLHIGNVSMLILLIHRELIYYGFKKI